MGLFSYEGPSETQVEGTSYSEAKRVLIVMGQLFDKPDKKLFGMVRGPEITYPLTSQCAVQSAITLLEERERLHSL